MQKHMITLEGYRDLVDRVNYYKNTRLAEALKDVSEGMEDHDFREDSRVMIALEERNRIQEKLGELQSLLKSATIVDCLESDDQVSFGMYVHIKNLDSDEEKVFRLVGKTESKPKQGNISYLSPFGQAMLGKSIDDDFEVVSPKGESYWEIIKISPQAISI